MGFFVCQTNFKTTNVFCRAVLFPEMSRRRRGKVINNVINEHLLHKAARRGDVHLVKTLLKQGVPVDLQTTHGDFQNALMLACNNGHNSIVQVLLENKANVNKTSRRGWTPLMWASFFNQVGCVKLLLAHKADLSIRASSDVWKGEIALDFATRPESFLVMDREQLTNSFSVMHREELISLLSPAPTDPLAPWPIALLFPRQQP